MTEQTGATVQRTTTHAVCPWCGHEAGCIDHLIGLTTQTTWYCDTCGHAYALQFDASGVVAISQAPGRNISTTDVLVLPPQDTPVYFVVPGMRFEGRADEDVRDEAAHKHYFYEEHSCPVNWLRPEMVSHEGNSDPHGLLRFVVSVDSETLPPDETSGPNDHDDALERLIEAHPWKPE